MAYSELEQALLDRLRVNDTERLAVLSEQLAEDGDAIAAAARALQPEGVRLELDEDERELWVVYRRPGGTRIASPGDDQPPA